MALTDYTSTIWPIADHARLDEVLDDLKGMTKEFTGKTGWSDLSFSDAYMSHFPSEPITSSTRVAEGKTLTTEKLKAAVDLLGPALRGRTGDFIVVDSYPFPDWLAGTSRSGAEKHDRDLLAVFDDPKHPELKVTVRYEGFSKHDPRNPNPKAPATRAPRIFVNNKPTRQRFQRSDRAVAVAEKLHKDLVRAKLDQEHALIRELPNFGRFA